MATSTRKVVGRSGMSRIEQNLLKSKEAKNFYESHQFYITLNHRFHSKGKDLQARNLMAEGAKFFYENEQFESCLHLALLYVESLEKNVKVINDQIIKLLSSLHKMIPKDLSDFENFQNRSIRWSATCADMPKTGNRTLRKEFAVNLWNESMFADARQQFIYSDNGNYFGEMLVQFSIRHGRPEECDLFMAQAVLQLLAIKSIDVAKDVFRTYTHKHPKFASGPPFVYPLANFLFFLMNAISNKRLDWYQALVDVYHVSLQRDPTFHRYVSMIGSGYFGLKSKSHGKSSRSFLENMFQGFFNSNDEAQNESDEESEDEASDDETTVTIEDDLD